MSAATLTLFVSRNFVFQAVDITIGVKDDTRGEIVSIAKPLIFEPYKDYGACPAPTMSLDLKAAQQLMDELWLCGIRPTETAGASALKATQDHLADMRRLVFDFLQEKL